MRYRVDRIVPFARDRVWRSLADLRHFAADEDPFHHQLTFTGPEEGRGARFTMEHTYWPIFPFPRDRVEAEVTEWQPPERLTVLERNPRRRIMSHTQRFLVEEVAPGRSRVIFEIVYRGIPWLLLPWKLWVDHRVTARMRDKLAELEAAIA